MAPRRPRMWMMVALVVFGAVPVEAASQEDAQESLDRVAIARRELEALQGMVDSDDPRLAEAHIEYGHRLAEQDRRSEAAREYARALDLRESAYGTEHIATAEVMAILAEARHAVGDSEQALDLALRAQGKASREFGRLATGLTGDEVLRFATVREVAEGVMLDILSSIEGDRQVPVAEQTWHQLVPARAAVLDASLFRDRVLSRGYSGELQEEIDALIAAQEELAALMASGEGGESYREKANAVAVRRAGLEHAIAEERFEFEGMLAARLVGLSEVSAALPVETSLIGYFRYLSGGPTSGRSEPRYLAIVLPDRMSEPVVVVLGSAATIDKQIREWKRDAGTSPPSDPEQARLAEQAYRRAGDALRRLLWDPIADSVTLGKQVFVVPDGPIRIVSFGALPATTTHYLVETGPAVHYVSAERDLMRYSTRRAGGNGLLAVGGVDYDASVRGVVRETEDDDPWVPSCDALAALRFSAVTGSRDQAAAAVSAWKTRFPVGGAQTTALLTAGDAAEIAVRRQARGRAMLHLATRGFFAQDACRPPQPAPEGVAALLAARQDDDARRFVIDPLVLGGVALAGANDRGSDGPASSMNDGLLTTREIASLDLRGADWVILSATDTGAGDPETTAGVFAMQRALVATGARSLVMSQWVADGATTAALMGRLYRHRLDGRSTLDALRAATIETIEARRESGASTHPYYWGAFVATGDWR